MNQQEQNNIEELYALVRGQVQGVGYRYFVIQKAHSLNLRGYVRNLSNGDVEVLAQGPRPALERLYHLLWQGPSAAQVDRVEATWRTPTTHLTGFHVRW
jgi:acylphosphatase